MTRNVCLIEDDDAVCDLIKHSLKLQGICVTRISTASIAKAVIQNQDFDVFIVDLGLVGTEDGRNVLEYLHKVRPDDKNKILVHTSKSLNPVERKKFFELAARVIPKGPTSIAQISGFINEAH